MGSNWTNITLEPMDDLPDKYKASASPPEPSDVVFNKIENKGDRLINRLPTYQRSIVKDTESLARELFIEIPCRRILFVRISDSTHAGDGVLYRRGSNEEPIRVDKWEGYEQADGADVVGYFEEEHRITGSHEDPW